MLAEDQSFSEVNDLERKKLGLEKHTSVSLVQLRDGKEVDLEDGESCRIIKTVVVPNIFRRG